MAAKVDDYIRKSKSDAYVAESDSYTKKRTQITLIQQIYTDFTSLYREEGHAYVMPHRGDLAVGR